MSLSPQQHKSAFIMRLLNNPFHPKNKEIVQHNYGIQLPYLHKRTGVSVSCWKISFIYIIILSSYTHPHVVPSKLVWLYFFCRTQKIIFEECWLNDYMRHFSKYLLLGSTEEIKSHRFEMTWVWVNNDRIVFFVCVNCPSNTIVYLFFYFTCMD